MGKVAKELFLDFWNGSRFGGDFIQYQWHKTINAMKKLPEVSMKMDNKERYKE